MCIDDTKVLQTTISNGIKISKVIRLVFSVSKLELQYIKKEPSVVLSTGDSSGFNYLTYALC